MAWDRPEDSESAWEPVSSVFDGAMAVQQSKLKPQRLKMIQNGNSCRGMGWVLIILWFGGDPEF